MTPLGLLGVATGGGSLPPLFRSVRDEVVGAGWAPATAIEPALALYVESKDVEVGDAPITAPVDVALSAHVLAAGVLAALWQAGFGLPAGNHVKLRSEKLAATVPDHRGRRGARCVRSCGRLALTLDKFDDLN